MSANIFKFGISGKRVADIAVTRAAALFATAGVVSFHVSEIKKTKSVHEDEFVKHGHHRSNVSFCDAALESRQEPRLSKHYLDVSGGTGNNSKLRKRMTAVGRFSLVSETTDNPSIPTFFVALAGHPTKFKNEKYDSGMDLEEFGKLWTDKDLSGRHDRFASKIGGGGNEELFFEPASSDIQDYVQETFMPYDSYRVGLQKTIEHMLISKLDVEKQLWEGILCRGPLGSSGAISTQKVREIRQNDPTVQNETVIALRAHHALADGVSLTAAMAELADESEELHRAIAMELKARRRKAIQKINSMSWLQRLLHKLQNIFGFWIWGSIKAIFYHGYLLLVSSPNPFEDLIPSMNEDNILLSSDASGNKISRRTVSWCTLAPIKNVTSVAKTLYPKATINDLMTMCVSYAVSRQLEEYKEKCLFVVNGTNGEENEKEISRIQLPRYVNVAVPVHLRGGVVPRGESMGNRIGAMIARVPVPVLNHHQEGKQNESKRLEETSKALTFVKQTPMAFLGYMFTKVASSSNLPPSLCQWLFRTSNANATFVISNVRGPTSELHWNGRPIVSTAGFVPLPPGIPIGVIVQSYNGMIMLSLTADGKVIPDADKFVAWMVEGYEALCLEAATRKEEKL